jgi:peptidoglycan/xylan/chitin deacetylase (PgdA/CDA1 family)
MKTQVVLTVDTEPSVAGAFANTSHRPLIHEPIAGIVGGKSEALGFLLDTLNRYGLVATFFVETLHTRYFSDAAMGFYVEQLVRAGQDVQLHLHPCWLAFENGRREHAAPLTDQCSELELGQLAALINEGARQIHTWTGTRPTGMRTGNFSTALSVFAAMKEAGLRHASNTCVAVNRPAEAELAVAGGAYDFAGIRELPVTCFADTGPVGHGRLRPMQVTALTAHEQIGLLNLAHQYGNPVVVIVTHPFEFIKRSDCRFNNLRRNRMVQNRLRRLCRFLSENRDRFEVVPLAAAAAVVGARAAWKELQGSAVSSLIRAAANAINDRLAYV